MAFGWMTKVRAKDAGFTNHGSYYGIPLYITDDAAPMVCPKHVLLEPVMDLFVSIEMFLFPIVHGAEAEPVFRFVVGKKIEVPNARPD